MSAWTVLPGRYAIARLAHDAELPAWPRGALVAITRTPDELSIVCEADAVPSGGIADRGWYCLKLNGPLPLNQTGIAAAFTRTLAEAGMAVFVISTYDTDYVLVRDAERALAALAAV
jgi:hypothetical protein